jgi:ribosomal protein S5|mmetsp:Transcript_7626/g.20799  ORF Transcript_7626/g.20799 Transcript_7626/m.20799 type:complete len:266 (-) Transcript_7626:91-888(-)
MQTTIATRTPCVARVAPSQPATRMCSSVRSISSARVFANAPSKMTGPISARPATIVAARRDDRGENDGFQYGFALGQFHPHAPGCSRPPHRSLTPAAHPVARVFNRDRVIQVRRVTKVVKGGKQLRFRAVVVVGNENGTVGVGCASAKEVVMAVQKAAVDAKRNLVTVPLSKSSSFPHRFDGVFGAARVMLRPAAEGTGVIAGGAVRSVLELAGVKNGFGKQLGSDNALNNAKATVEGLKAMRTFKDVARERGLPLEHFLPGTAK